MKRRGLTIALAVLLAIFGTAGVLAYVNHANARALAGQKAVTVLIAKSLIPSGTSAADAQRQGLLGPETLPAASVPADAVTAVTPGISALVTDSDVQPGQLLLRSMLVTKAQVSTGLAIPKGMIAVSILFCVPEAVAGNIHPGSQVMVFDTVVTSTSGSGSASASGLSAGVECNGPHDTNPGITVTTKLVLPKVTVLSVGQASADGQKSGSSGFVASSTSNSHSELLTVAVSQNDAERMIQLAVNGLPYLALANAG